MGDFTLLIHSNSFRCIDSRAIQMLWTILTRVFKHLTQLIGLPCIRIGKWQKLNSCSFEYLIGVTYMSYGQKLYLYLYL